MLLQIPNVLSALELEAVREVLDQAQFVDGKLSAGMAASRVKNNLEMDRQSPELQRLNNLVMGNLIRHPRYRSAALSNRVATPFYACYEPGMAYGEHVDDPVMGPMGGQYRCDLACTIFLNAPEDYDGGELNVRTSFGEQRVKLNAGDAILYPASSLHQVREVTRGKRLVAVAWIQSLIRDPAQRELLYELDQAREHLLKNDPDAEHTARVNHAYNNLVRMWADV